MISRKEEFQIAEGELIQYTGNSETVVIPSKVVRIGDYAFANCNRIRSVELPESVKELGESAFLGCQALTEVIIKGELSYLGDQAFAECCQLKKIELRPSLNARYIGGGVFKGCDNLADSDGFIIMNGKLYQYCDSKKETSIPQKVEYIWDNAFMGNRTIEKITIPDGIVGIGYAAFANCINLKEVSLPEGLTEIPAYCFYNCPKLGPSISLPKSTKFVGASAFSQCKGLQIVFLPEKAGIGVLAFENCSGMWLINPEVKHSPILFRAFYGCKRLPEELLREFEEKALEVPVTDISCTRLGLSRLREYDLVPNRLVSVRDLVSHTEEELQKMKNIKPRDIKEIKNVLGRLGLSLRSNIDQKESEEMLSETMMAQAVKEAKAFYNRGEYDKAFQVFRDAAEKGDSEAQIQIGRCYEYGNGVKQDEAKAFEWYSKAVAQDYDEGWCCLASCYELGIGIKKDYLEGIRLYLVAAERGHPRAQNNLGSCFEHGNGVTKDIDIAIRWYHHAAIGGNQYAKRNLKRLGIEEETTVTLEELHDLITITKTKREERLQEERAGCADKGGFAENKIKRNVFEEDDEALVDSNPTLPVILKENEILAGLNNQQYLTYAKRQVVDFFKFEDWHYREIITQPDLIAWELGMSGDHFIVRMRVAVEADPRVCRIDAILPTSVDPTYDAILCKEIMRLNQPLRYGAFQYDEMDGELSYRYSFSTKNGLYSDDLSRVFMAVLLTAKQNFSKLQKYAVGKFTRAEEKQIQEYVERLMRDLELDDLTQ